MLVFFFLCFCFCFVSVFFFLCVFVWCFCVFFGFWMFFFPPPRFFGVFFERVCVFFYVTKSFQKAEQNKHVLSFLRGCYCQFVFGTGPKNQS